MGQIAATLTYEISSRHLFLMIASRAGRVRVELNLVLAKTEGRHD